MDHRPQPARLRRPAVTGALSSIVLVSCTIRAEPAPTCPEPAPLAAAPGCAGRCPDFTPPTCEDVAITEQVCRDERDDTAYRVLVDDRGNDRIVRYFHEDDRALVAVAAPGSDPACAPLRWWGEDLSTCRALEVVRRACDDTDEPSPPDTDVEPGVCGPGPLALSPVCGGTACPAFDRLDRCAPGRRDPHEGSCAPFGVDALDLFRFTAADGSVVTVYGDPVGAVVAVSRSPLPGTSCVGWWGQDLTACATDAVLTPVGCGPGDTDEDTDSDLPVDTAPGDTDTGWHCLDSGLGACPP